MTALINRLSNETSPYLLQHADNPVHWQPWDEQALAAAREDDKPILVSIGYSACHWCHVMAHESFEDPDTAAMLNERLINIKVDREERPDLDKVYQTAFQLLNRRGGGWPLTLFLSPATLTPFFAGTYFPHQPRHGMPDFKTVVRYVTEYFHGHRSEVETHALSLREAFAQLQASSQPTSHPDGHLLAKATRTLAGQYDPANGGFGLAPKFPRPGALELLLDSPDSELVEYALHTLRCMGNGGLFDQIGGGFYRYSVDARWTIPHFEKMLYDNGALLRLYAHAARLTGDPRFMQITTLTADWLIESMQSGAGGFYSSFDADSAGGEGEYYLWSLEQLSSLLSADEYALAVARFGLHGKPNFAGRWHLNVHADVATLAARQKATPTAIMALLAAIQGRLLTARAQRLPPARDDKILAAWNGIAIRGLVTAGRCLDDSRWIDAACRALDFVQTRLWRHGRLCATYNDNRARFNGYLDDYAFMAMGCIELLRTRWRTSDLEFACALCDAMLAHFEDSDRGGFWFTADDHETLLDRPRAFADESMAAGNGMAAQVLISLGHLLGEVRYLDAGARTLTAAAGALGAAPDVMCSSLTALRDQLRAPPQLILRGNADALHAWRRQIEAHTNTRLWLYAIPDDSAALPGLLAECKADSGGVAYLCADRTCSAPLYSPDAVLAKVADMVREPG